MRSPIVRLQPQRHKRAQGGHPWVYSNEVVTDDPSVKTADPGMVVEFRTHDKQFLGSGTFNPKTLIAGRIFTRKHLEAIDAEFVLKRMRDALDLRDKLYSKPFYRLIHAEADGLPGLIVDRYGDHVSLQSNTAGMEKLLPFVIEAINELIKPETITLRNESAARSLEGLDRQTKSVKGEMKGPIVIEENGLKYFADLTAGQKTGWYFDQRENRASVASFARGAKVLDLYCNAGGFSLAAAKAGAKSVLGIDSSETALALARKAAEKNKCEDVTFERGDVFEALTAIAKKGEKFGVVIADPPAFAKSRKDIASGARGYRKLASLAASVTSYQGLLFIASCSYNMELANFIEQVAKGVFEAGRHARILKTTFAAADHPVHPQLPESAYLKGLLLRLD